MAYLGSCDYHRLADSIRNSGDAFQGQLRKKARGNNRTSERSFDEGSALS